MKVNLNDVIEAIEFENELLTHYYNKRTGVIIYLEDSSTASYSCGDIERIDEFEEWEQVLIKELYDLEKNPEDYIQLPDKDVIDEYSMMIEFCISLNNEELNKISHQKRDFRDIKEAIEKAGLLSEWYDYREEAEYNLAVKWCKENNIEYIE